MNTAGGLAGFFADAQQFKLWLLDLTGVQRDGLHVLVGTLTYCLARRLMPRRSARGALIAVAIVACLLELPDFGGDFLHHGRTDPGASLHDLIVTLSGPVIIALLLGYGRRA